jgi:hypothetical protein
MSLCVGTVDTFFGFQQNLFWHYYSNFKFNFWGRKLSHEFGLFWASIFYFQELVVQIWRLISGYVLLAYLLDVDDSLRLFLSQSKVYFQRIIEIVLRCCPSARGKNRAVVLVQLGPHVFISHQSQSQFLSQEWFLHKIVITDWIYNMKPK